MPKTVLVTGSLGYIGSRLTPMLGARGFRCIGYDPGFFRDCTLTAPSDPETIRKDLRQMEPSDLEGVDVLIHLAAISNDPFGDLTPRQIYDPTRSYTLRLAQACKERGIRFVFASSCSVYGIGGEEPVSEESPAFPQTAYSVNKLQIEEDLARMSDERFSPIILRLATVFGPSSRIRFDLCINMFAGMALTDGRILLNSNGVSWRPSVHIEDVCRAFAFAAGHPGSGGRPLILNVGDDRANFRIIDLARRVQEEVPGCRLDFLGRPGGVPEAGLDLVRDRNVKNGVDVRTYKVSFGRIREAFKGFECEWTVEEGIRALLADLRRVPLTKEQFQSARFYRLPRFRALFEKGLLNGDLSWKSRPEPASAFKEVRSE